MALGSRHLERINAGEPSAETEDTVSVSRTPNQADRGSRDVPLGLRFKCFRETDSGACCAATTRPLIPIAFCTWITSSLGRWAEQPNLKTFELSVRTAMYPQIQLDIARPL